MQALTQAACTNVKLSGSIREATRSTTKCSLKTNFCSGVSYASNEVTFKIPVGGRSRRAVVTMAKATPASGYAAALVEVGKGNGSLEAIHKDVEALSSLLKDEGLKSFIESPVFEDEKKKQVLKSLAQDSKFTPATLNFLNLLVDKKRINVLSEVTAVFEELYYNETDTQVAVVTSAVKLENSQQALIAKKLQNITGAKNVKLKNVVDSSLIAGFVLKYGKDGSNEIDMSVKGQLEKLEYQFNEAQPTVD